MPVFPENPNLGQQIQGSVPVGATQSVPALRKAYAARWSKIPAAPAAAAVLPATALPSSGTTTITAPNGETQTISSGSATGGDFNLTFNGQTTAGTSEIDTVSLGSPTGGTFTLTVKSQTTGAIPYNAPASVVQAALVALSTVGAGNVTVSGAAGGPYTVTFTGLLSGVGVVLTGSGGGLTSGTFAVTRTTSGLGIAYNATAATVQAALQALPSIGALGATVTGNAGGPWTVTFTGNLANVNVPLLTFSDDTSGGTGVTVTLATGCINPDVPRNVSIVGNAGGIAGNVIVNGTDLAGVSITETLALNGTTTVNGSKAFKTITSVVLPTQTHGGDTVSVGIGSKLGLHHLLPHNTVVFAFLNNVKEGTAPTVAVDPLNLSLNTATLNSAIPGAQVVDLYYFIP